jgi:hypothetical protein
VFARRWTVRVCAVMVAFLLATPATLAASPLSDTTVSSQSSAEPELDRTAGASSPPPDATRVRFGALVGIGFPQPIAFEGMVKVLGYVSVGAEYGVLPAITVDGFDTSAWSLAGTLRIYPFRDSFFVGLDAGYQRVSAAGTITVAAFTSPPETSALETAFLSPKVGFLWRMSYGLAVGIDAGAEVPVSTNFDTTMPSVAAVWAKRSEVVRTLSGPLPILDLRLGYLF